MAEKMSGLITYTASGTAVVAGLTIGEWSAVIGATVAVTSFLVNIYYKERHYRLARNRKLVPDCPNGADCAGIND